MVSPGMRDTIYDPVEVFNRILEHAWEVICVSYDVAAGIPSMRTLFSGADLDAPEAAASQVVVNMLTEVIEQVGRFSPWYTLPARAFGLARVQDRATHQTRWILAPEAGLKWQKVLLPLATAIENNSALIQAVLLVDDLMAKKLSVEPRVVAVCACTPPRAIQIRPSILKQAGIRCDCCSRPFLIVDHPSG